VAREGAEGTGGCHECPREDVHLSTRRTARRVATTAMSPSPTLATR
jgi:hypothetical protein